MSDAERIAELEAANEELRQSGPDLADSLRREAAAASKYTDQLAQMVALSEESRSRAWTQCLQQIIENILLRREHRRAVALLGAEITALNYELEQAKVQ